MTMVINPLVTGTALPSMEYVRGSAWFLATIFSEYRLWDR